MSSASPSFHVTYSGRAQRQFAVAHQRAYHLGLQSATMEAVDRIHSILSSIPATWGDPLRDLPALGVKLFRGWHAMFVVYYGVDEVNRIVYVSRVDIASWSPLFQADD